VDATVTSPAAKGASLEDAISQSGSGAELLALLAALKQQNDVIAGITA
jgi:D-arabinose 5-phosphate isomerase GutQ